MLLLLLLLLLLVVVVVVVVLLLLLLPLLLLGMFVVTALSPDVVTIALAVVCGRSGDNLVMATFASVVVESSTVRDIVVSEGLVASASTDKEKD